MKNILELENKLWLDGVSNIETQIDSDCIIILPPPISMLRGDEIGKSIDSLPNWDKVSFTDMDIAKRDSDNIIFLTYKVTANSKSQPQYKAICSTSYMKKGDNYKIILHQQTPFY